ncbi:hypothetical protein HanXRQr2_Chr14g0637851 [Helianthus annuus]|uniref:Uncharacterized protein n=1 Tax=Helianthus annuus TaxID=4232 RepID=A0A251SFS6_HELAN|nr:hypothetical protein HanXRQr2_Chr14g0637851 [Helianthus annuus]KAJ0463788.1 hypothetical protein HanHA300_Chr14g0519571 [Helianthus annuus]KAJ0485293.1 hypothetical protein HanHA89_Chr14g0566591 [Helianthus annuus]KAJ0655837.1 hypothetical protein HanLR1_Chr14g0528861 [Helianthus annuus]KAJ0839859.1 hypothetical protein HanPSC8_Chr14g0611791 [Helianthus annuus]
MNNNSSCGSDWAFVDVANLFIQNSLLMNWDVDRKLFSLTLNDCFSNYITGTKFGIREGRFSCEQERVDFKRAASADVSSQCKSSQK